MRLEIDLSNANTRGWYAEDSGQDQLSAKPETVS